MCVQNKNKKKQVDGEMKVCDDGENNPDDYITAVFML